MDAWCWRSIVVNKTETESCKGFGDMRFRMSILGVIVGMLELCWRGLYNSSARAARHAAPTDAKASLRHGDAHGPAVVTFNFCDLFDAVVLCCAGQIETAKKHFKLVWCVGARQCTIWRADTMLQSWDNAACLEIFKKYALLDRSKVKYQIPQTSVKNFPDFNETLINFVEHLELMS